MNKIMWVIVLVLVILVGVYIVYHPISNNMSPNTAVQQEQTGPQGRVVFSVTDAAVNMSTISEINMQVSEVDIHNNTDGWVTVSNSPQTFSLLMLNAKNQSQLLVDSTAKAGTYDQVRLVVSSIVVKTKAGATEPAKLPSNELKINTNLVINQDGTSSVNLDFMASKSLHITGSGLYIFTPVVKTESKSDANIMVNSDDTVSITGGHSDDENTSGMDIDGTVKANFQINANQKLDIDSNNQIQLQGALLK